METKTVSNPFLDEPGEPAALRGTHSGKGPNICVQAHEVRVALQDFEPRAASAAASVPESRSGTPTTFARRCATAALITAIVAASGYGAYRWWEQARIWVATDNAYVAAHIHQISSRVAGTVSEVVVDENQSVKAGEIVARLDSRDFAVRLDQVHAQVAQAHAQNEQGQAQIAQAQAQVAQEQARDTKAQQDLARAESLFYGAAGWQPGWQPAEQQAGQPAVRGAISKQELDAAQAGHAASRAALRAAQSALESAQASAAAAAAQEQAAQAGLQEAQLQLSYTAICAPANGRIGRRNVETGNRVQPGQALLALVQPDVWIAANFKETQLAHLLPGQPARLRVDAFPGRVFSGWVEGLAPASGAQFALFPPDNATGNFTKIVQRVPVKIRFDPQSLGDYAGRIVAGMSAVVEVDIRATASHK